MGRIENPSQHSKQEVTRSRLPKYRVSDLSQRLVEMQLGTDVWVYTQKDCQFFAQVMRVIDTPKQPNNPQIEVQIKWDPVQKIRLGSGTSVIKSSRQ